MDFRFDIIINAFPLLIEGAIFTIQITALSVAIGIIIGLFVGIIDIFIVAFLSLLLCFISLKNNNISFFSYINNSLIASIFFIISGIISIFLLIVIQFINMRNIYETVEYTYNDYKINLKYSIIGFVIISMAVFIFNMFFSPHHIWFVFVIIYFLSWPLTVFLFYQFFKNSDKNINRK